MRPTISISALDRFPIYGKKKEEREERNQSALSLLPLSSPPLQVFVSGLDRRGGVEPWRLRTTEPKEEGKSHLLRKNFVFVKAIPKIWRPRTAILERLTDELVCAKCWLWVYTIAEAATGLTPTEYTEAKVDVTQEIEQRAKWSAPAWAACCALCSISGVISTLASV